MGIRRKARELSLQVIYCADFHDCWEEAALKFTFQHFDVEKSKVGSYSARLIFGIYDNLKYIDRLIADASHHWSINRMSRIDRCLLRLATYEIAFSDGALGIPPKTSISEEKLSGVMVEAVPATVAINEAIELAKEYGTEESPSFVNGVLDQVACIHQSLEAA